MVDIFIDQSNASAESFYDWGSAADVWLFVVPSITLWLALTGLLGTLTGLLHGKVRKAWGRCIYLKNSITHWAKAWSGSVGEQVTQRVVTSVSDSISTSMFWCIGAIFGIPAWAYKKTKLACVRIYLWSKNNKLTLVTVFVSSVALGIFWQRRKLAKTLQKAQEEKNEVVIAEVELARNNLQGESKALEYGPVADVLRRAVLAGCAYVSLLGVIKGSMDNLVIRDLIWLVGSIFRMLTSSHAPGVCSESNPCCPRRRRHGAFVGVSMDCNCACHDAPIEFAKGPTVPGVNVATQGEEDSGAGVGFDTQVPPEEAEALKEAGFDIDRDLPTLERVDEQTVEQAMDMAESVAILVDDKTVTDDIFFLRQVLARVKSFFGNLVRCIIRRVNSVDMFLAVLGACGFALGAVCFYYYPYLKRRGGVLWADFVDAKNCIVDTAVTVKDNVADNVVPHAHEVEVQSVQVAVNNGTAKDGTGLYTELMELKKQTGNYPGGPNNRMGPGRYAGDGVAIAIPLDVETKKGKTKAKVRINAPVKKHGKKERGAHIDDRTYTQTATDLSTLNEMTDDDDWIDREFSHWSEDDDEAVNEEYRQRELEEMEEWQRQNVANTYGDYIAYVATDKRWQRESFNVNIPDITELPEKVSPSVNIKGDDMFHVIVETKGSVKLFAYECPLCKNQKHPIARCPKNKDRTWRFISKKSGAIKGAVPSDDLIEVEMGYVYNSRKVVYDPKTKLINLIGVQSKIEGVPIIDVENFDSMVVPIYDEKKDFAHCGIPLGNYIVGPNHGQGTEPLQLRRFADGVETWIPLEIAEEAPNVPLIWAADDVIFYKKPQNLKSTARGTAPVEKGKVYIVGYHNGRLAFSGPRALLAKETSAVSHAKLQMLIHDCSTDLGFSGGALVNAETGKVCGIHLGTRQKNKENYAADLSDPVVSEVLSRPILKKPAASKQVPTSGLN